MGIKENIEHVEKKHDSMINIIAYIFMVGLGLFLIFLNAKFTLRDTGIIIGTWLILAAYYSYLWETKLKNLRRKNE